MISLGYIWLGEGRGEASRDRLQITKIWNIPMRLIIIPTFNSTKYHCSKEQHSGGGQD